MKFTDFSDFLEQTANDDRQFVGLDDFCIIPETVCALANSSGGWVICGAEKDENDEINIYGLEENFDVVNFIDEKFNAHKTLNENFSYGFHENSDAHKTLKTKFFGGLISYELYDFGNIKAIYIYPVEFYMKPLIYDEKVFRRVEGINLISSKLTRSIFVKDAQEFSRDDFPVRTSRLNIHEINEFRKRVINIHDEYKTFSRIEFLRRCGVYSGKFLTFAGALMFGEIIHVNARLKYSSGIAELEARNIWRAYNEILPKLTCRLSRKCAGAFREIFINSLLHSDYNISRKINISITSNPPKVLIDNPGIIRGTTRNYRLKKMFELAGFSRDTKAIKLYAPNFALQQDMLNFRVRARLQLEGLETLPDPIIL